MTKIRTNSNIDGGIDRLLMVAALLVSVATLTACGQKGALVLTSSSPQATNFELGTTSLGATSDDVAQ